MVHSVQQEKQQEHRATYARIVSEAQQRTLEALPEATAAQAAIIAATATDKVRVIDGMPTSIKGESNSIKMLAQQFADLSQAQRRLEADHTAITDSVVSTQVPDNKE